MFLFVTEEFHLCNFCLDRSPKTFYLNDILRTYDVNDVTSQYVSRVNDKKRYIFTENHRLYVGRSNKSNYRNPPCGQVYTSF